MYVAKINPPITQISRIFSFNLCNLRHLRIMIFKRLRGEKISLQQNQPSAGSEAQNLSNKSLTISNPFEDIIPIVVKLD
jgi:hypothetical protein